MPGVCGVDLLRAAEQIEIRGDDVVGRVAAQDDVHAADVEHACVRRVGRRRRLRARVSATAPRREPTASADAARRSASRDRRSAARVMACARRRACVALNQFVRR